jgi:antitoxin component YwqK of YwqJK toxin-antitoxin module
MYKTIASFFLFTSILFGQSGKEYHTIKGENGEILSEGWMVDGLKNEYWTIYYPNELIASKGHFKEGLKEKYWYFYQPNNCLEKEGHFSFGLMSSWWVFYDKEGTVVCKVQYEKDKKQGYCIQYKKRKITKIEKYQADVKTGEWKDLKSFELENDLKSLLN